VARAKKASVRAKLDVTRLLWMGGFAVLLVAIASTGLQRVVAAHEMRALYGSLGANQHEQDALLEERSRLMLERGAISSMHNIETYAQTELGMHFPLGIGQVLQ